MESQLIVCVDGLIGAGKSTLLKRISKNYSCFPEPLSEWNLLPKLYENPKEFGLAFEIQVLISQFKQKHEFPNTLVFVERCPWTTYHIFNPLILTEEEICFFDLLYKRYAYKVDYFIYLDIEPSKAFERIQKRSATDQKISLDYLNKLYDQYKSKLLSLPNVLCVIDANKSQEEIEHQVMQAVKTLV